MSSGGQGSSSRRRGRQGGPWRLWAAQLELPLQADGRRHPSTCPPPPPASATLGLSIQEESSCSLSPRPLAVAPWGGGPFLALHTRYSCLLTHVSAGRAGWQGGLSPERDSDSGSPPGRHRAGMGPQGMALAGRGGARVSAWPPKTLWRSPCLRETFAGCPFPGRIWPWSGWRQQEMS